MSSKSPSDVHSQCWDCIRTLGTDYPAYLFLHIRERLLQSDSFKSTLIPSTQEDALGFSWVSHVLF